MSTYQRETRIRAPLEDVWAFHSSVSGLEALTPEWMGLRVESVMGADGGPDPDVLEAGAEISLSIRPFDVGPRRRWTSVITARERSTGTAFFRDEMVRGPFDTWVHTHSFYADGEETVLRDHVEFVLPFGTLGDLASPFSPVGFEPMFRTRHRRTKARLESSSGDEPNGF